jgi:hypothetical protein
MKFKNRQQETVVIEVKMVVALGILNGENKTRKVLGCSKKFHFLIWVMITDYIHV